MRGLAGSHPACGLFAHSAPFPVSPCCWVISRRTGAGRPRSRRRYVPGPGLPSLMSASAGTGEDVQEDRSQRGYGPADTLGQVLGRSSARLTRMPVMPSASATAVKSGVSSSVLNSGRPGCSSSSVPRRSSPKATASSAAADYGRSQDRRGASRVPRHRRRRRLAGPGPGLCADRLRHRVGHLPTGIDVRWCLPPSGSKTEVPAGQQKNRVHRGSDEDGRTAPAGVPDTFRARFPPQRGGARAPAQDGPRVPWSRGCRLVRSRPRRGGAARRLASRRLPPARWRPVGRGRRWHDRPIASTRQPSECVARRCSFCDSRAAGPPTARCYGSYGAPPTPPAHSSATRAGTA